MLNKVATDYWIYGEYGDGFGKPLNAFFTPREGDDLHHLNQAGESENLIWGKSDLKSGEFKFTEFLDCKHVHRNTNTNTVGIGYELRCARFDEVSENDSSNFSQSLKWIKAGINKSRVTQPPSTLRTSQVILSIS